MVCWLALLVCSSAVAQQSNDIGTSTESTKAPPSQQSSSDQSSTAEIVKAPAKPNPEFVSPRAVMMTFLDAMNRAGKETGEQRKKMIDLAVETLQIPADGNITDDSVDLATKLWGILNRLHLVRDIYLPDESWIKAYDLKSFDYYPRQKGTYYYYGIPEWKTKGTVRVYPPFDTKFPDGVIRFVRLENGEWRFSAKTVSQIHNFYTAVEDLSPRIDVDERSLSLPLRIRSYFPKSMRDDEFAGIEYWQWISLFIFIFIGLVVDLLLRVVFRFIVKAIIKRRGASASNEAIQGLVRPLGLLCAGLVWTVLLPALGLAKTPHDILFVAVHLLTMVAGVWAAFRVTDVVGEALASKAAQTDTKFDDLLVPLVRKSAKVFILAFGLIYIADSLNIEILPLLTGLGIGGAAIAFASKDTIENFFGSIAVIVDRPFEVGDWIATGDVEGTVESLGFRSTRVRTFYNSLITIPNSNLVRAVVDNYGQRKYRRYKTTVSLTYDTPPDKIEAFCEGIRETIRLHPYTRKDYYHVWLNEFNDSSLDVLVYIFFETPEWGTELRERHRFMLDVIRLADELGVEFAFPTQTLHLYKEETNRETADSIVNPSAVKPVPQKEERRSRRLGARVARKINEEAEWRNGIKPEPVQFGAVALPDPEADPDSQIEDRTAGG